MVLAKVDYIYQYADMIYRIAFHYFQNKYDAEDVMQNVLLKFYTSEKEFESDDYRINWLIRVTINECKKIFVSPWKKRTLSIEEYGQEIEWKQEEQSELYYAVMELPRKYRIVTYFYYYEEYSIKEIAGILSKKESTIQTQLMRARAQLKEKLKEAWNDEE